MEQVSEAVKKFFDEYLRGNSAPDLEGIGSRYGESFLFAGPQSAQAVKKEDFLKVLPRRQGFFQAIGLVSTTIRSMQETRLDDQHILVRVVWVMRFEKQGQAPIDDENAATYILRLEDGALRIIFQLDHQDLAARAAALGMLPGG